MRIRYRRPIKAAGWAMFVMDLPDNLELPRGEALDQWLKAMEATEHLINWGVESEDITEEGSVHDFHIDETD
jgi:hypothetical protein